MQTRFQLGVLLLILGAVQCQEQLLRDQGSEVYRDERDLQKEDKALFGCSLCKKAVHEIFRIIGNEVSKDSIGQALNKVCGKLKAVQGICTKMINKYREKLIRVIQSAKTPHEVCQHIKLCKKRNKV